MSLRAGVVGWGDAGKIHARYLVEHGATLVGVVSRQNPGQGIKWFRSLEELLSEVDAVSITTPNDLHSGALIQAVRAGRAVLVEKPICIEREELDSLQMVLRGASVPIHVGFRLRFNETIQRLRRPEAPFRRIHCSYQLGIDRLAPAKSWIRERARSGGAYFILGIHCLDLARWICFANGRPLTGLVGMGDGRPEFPLQVSLAGELDGTQIGIAVDLRGSAPYHLRVSVEYEDGEKPRTVSLAGERPGVREEAEFSGLIRNFVDAARSGSPNPGEVAEFLQTHKELLDARDQIEGRSGPVSL